MMGLEHLEIYRLGVQLSHVAWEIYEPLDWRVRKIIGDQFITAADSYGANVAEAHGRYHYLDRAKFIFNARGSLCEAYHWLCVMHTRKLIREEDYLRCNSVIAEITPKLNQFIASLFARNNSDRKSHTRRPVDKPSKAKYDTMR